MTDVLSRTTEIQYAVGNPLKSAWVSANAGTGKTYVLVRRVIRQLLAGARPASIVCITYTKAGAAEMAERLMKMLGEWALMPDASLAEAIEAVTGEAPAKDSLGEARRLFARALESPGGLKVQTIHSFCTALLRRFPVEAGVPLGFRGIEDDEQKALLSEALRDIAKDAAAKDHLLHEDFNVITALLEGDTEEQGFGRVTLEGALLDYASRTRGLLTLPEKEHQVAALLAKALGASDQSVDELVQQCWDEFEVEHRSFASEFITVFEGEKSTTTAGQVRAGLLSAIEDGPSAAFVENAGVFTGKGTLRKSCAAKKQLGMVADCQDRWERMQTFFERWRDRVRRRQLLEENLHFYWIAQAALKLYEARKRADLALDYDDLIERSLKLLTKVDTAWVQFKLDEGIDHVLLDEAQDTSGVQWELFDALVSELKSRDLEAAGEDRARSLFVVGDPKQSIYAFQGADAALFATTRDKLKETLGDRLEMGELFLSFRTSQPVLDVVDAIFDRDPFRIVSGGYERHAFKEPDRPGSAELWPHFPEPEKAEVDQWERPVDAVDEASIDSRVAEAIALDIKRRLEQAEPLASRGGRAIRASDVMVLFQRRGVRFGEVLRALSDHGVPCAGTDRIKVAADTAVRDLIALLRFTANRDDSLSLATLLKSPLFGWDDNALMDLCIDRQQRLLWRELQRRAAGGDDRCAEAAQALRRMIDAGMRRGPYSLISAFLDGGGEATGHARLRQRLGTSYVDAVESFLDEAIAYEDNHPRSIHGFLVHAEKLNRDIKRETAGDEVTGVRVMTVHGAKGLEAPVVYCADADYLKSSSDHFQREIFVDVTSGEKNVPVMLKRKESLIPETILSYRQDAEDRRMEEYQRLFYVAATRAEEHLVICGGKEGKGAEWHALAMRGFEDLTDRTKLTERDAPWGGKIVRYGTSGDGVANDNEGAAAEEQSAAPDWINRVPASEEANPVIFPSLIGAREEEERGNAQAVGTEVRDARARGLFIHQLLEVLPDHRAEERGEIALRLAAPFTALNEEERQEAIADAEALLGRGDLEALFGPGSRAEVSIQGQLGGKTFSGQIDRLLMKPDLMIAAEYKATRWVPKSEADIPAAHSQQIETYLKLLRQMNGEAEVRGLLIYTAAPRVFEVG